MIINVQSNKIIFSSKNVHNTTFIKKIFFFVKNIFFICTKKKQLIFFFLNNRYWRSVLDSFYKRMKECDETIEELSRYLVSSNKNVETIKVLPEIFQNQRDFLVNLDFKITQLDEQLNSLKEKFLRKDKNIYFERQRERKLFQNFGYPHQQRLTLFIILSFIILCFSFYFLIRKSKQHNE